MDRTVKPDETHKTHEADAALVFAQLGQTLDGRIACQNGSSKYINGPGALDHLHALRAVVDAVVVGVGTVIADDPRLTVRRCDGETPRAVVIDPGRRTPHDAALFHAGDEPPLFVRRAGDIRDDNDMDAALIEHGGEYSGLLDPVTIITGLRERGYRRILIEGGAATLSHFIDHRAIDRLHILMAPIILGSGTMGINLAPIRNVGDALRPKIRMTQFDDGDVLYDCELESVWSR